jgi:hypothetical protein
VRPVVTPDVRRDVPRQPPTTTAVTQAPALAAPRGGVHGPLRTDGNRILDANGKTVVLRGVNRVGFGVTPSTYPAITDDEIARASAWGANVVRVPLDQSNLDTSCPSKYLPAYLDGLNTVVNSITSRGMVALLDLHTSTRTPCGQANRWRMADNPGSVNFWRAVAARFSANPLVAFELYNEPNDITSDQWLHGGQLVDPVMQQWTAAGMQTLYDTVRLTGATNVVVATGNSYGGDPEPILDGHAVTGTNVVYAIHAYTCPGSGETAWCVANANNKHARINPGWTQVAARYPVMITEFGWPDPNDGRYNASVIDLARAQDPPWGWTAFAWDGKTDGLFALVADLSTYKPTPAGVPVVSALAATGR